MLLACSDRKKDADGPCRAVDLYDGPSFRTIRKLEREGRFPKTLEIYIISGKYGLISSEDIIESYDRRIDEDVVRDTDARDKLRDLVSQGYANIFINMGKEYTRHFNDILGGATSARGRIGQKNAQMLEWILSL